MKPYHHFSKLLLLPLFAVPMLAQAAPAYTSVEFAGHADTFFRYQGTALNNHGTIIGNLGDYESSTAFATKNETVTYLDGQNIGTSNALGINDAGHIVGSSISYNGDQRGFLYSNGQMTFLDTLGGPFSSASAINQSGQIAGKSMLNNGRIHAVLYTNGAIQDIGTLGGGKSSASALNNNGQVVGSSRTTEGQTHAYSYSAGVMTDLGTLGGDTSFASDISNTGQIVGTATTGDGKTHAFLYSNGVMKDLHSLIEGATSSRATHINDMGQIILSSDKGQFLYSNGETVAINTLIEPYLGINDADYVDINDKGQISLIGNNGGSVVRLDPVAAVPEPETYGMLLAGLGLIGFMARRKAIRAQV